MTRLQSESRRSSWAGDFDNQQSGIESDRSTFHSIMVWTTFIECLLSIFLIVGWIHLASYSQAGGLRLFGSDVWIVLPLVSIVAGLLIVVASSRSESLPRYLVVGRVVLWFGITIVLVLTILNVMELHRSAYWTQGNVVARWIVLLSSFTLWFDLIPNLVATRYRMGEINRLTTRTAPSGEWWTDDDARPSSTVIVPIGGSSAPQPQRNPHHDEMY